MSKRTSWVLNRFALPLLVGLWMVSQRWGESNIAYILTVPVFLLFFHMYASYQERPQSPELERYRAFRSLLGRWNVWEVLALFLLLWVEVFVAAGAESRAVAVVVGAAMALVGPYTLLVWLARRNLLRARRLVDRQRKLSLIERLAAGTAGR
jgi:hypothetical protein